MTFRNKDIYIEEDAASDGILLEMQNLKKMPRFIYVGKSYSTCYLLDAMSDSFASTIAANYAQQVSNAIIQFIKLNNLTEREFTDNYILQQTYIEKDTLVDTDGKILFNYDFKIKKAKWSKK